MSEVKTRPLKVVLVESPDGRRLSHKYDIDTEWLKRMYCDNGLAPYQIADALGISSETVRRIIREKKLVRWALSEEDLEDLVYYVVEYIKEIPKATKHDIKKEFGINNTDADKLYVMAKTIIFTENSEKN